MYKLYFVTQKVICRTKSLGKSKEINKKHFFRMTQSHIDKAILVVYYYLYSHICMCIYIHAHSKNSEVSINACIYCKTIIFLGGVCSRYSQNDNKKCQRTCESNLLGFSNQAHQKVRKISYKKRCIHFFPYSNLNPVNDIEKCEESKTSVLIRIDVNMTHYAQKYVLEGCICQCDTLCYTKQYLKVHGL